MGKVIYMSSVCKEAGCDRPIAISGYCGMHYQRLRKQGAFAGRAEAKRQELAERGPKNAHPLFQAWMGAKVRGALAQEWLDFWTYVRDVEALPGDTKLMRIDPEKPLGPGNVRRSEKWTPERAKAYAQAYHEANKDDAKDKLRRKKYGIGNAEYEAMFQAQGGVCYICEIPETRLTNQGDGSVRSLHVDHDHESGSVRGLLCGSCNVGLGAFRDDEALLMKAAAYVIKHRRKRVAA